MVQFHPSNKIHKTAIVHDTVFMGKNNVIGPFCVIKGDVEIGDNNVFETGIVTDHKVTIGSDCKFYPYVSLGFAGEMGAKGDKLPEGKGVVIGNKVTIREFVNVHAPYWWENTQIGDESYIMNKSYIAHDCQIGKKVMVNAGVKLGGRAILQDFANVGMGATVHQRSIVGENAMVGMNAVVKKNIPPFAVVAGVPSRVLKFNIIGAKRRGIDEDYLKKVDENFMNLLKEGGNESGVVEQTLLTFFQTYPDTIRS